LNIAVGTELSETEDGVAHIQPAAIRGPPKVLLRSSAVAAYVMTTVTSSAIEPSGDPRLSPAGRRSVFASLGTCEGTAATAEARTSSSSLAPPPEEVRCRCSAFFLDIRIRVRNIPGACGSELKFSSRKWAVNTRLVYRSPSDDKGALTRLMSVLAGAFTAGWFERWELHARFHRVALRLHRSSGLRLSRLELEIL